MWRGAPIPKSGRLRVHRHTSPHQPASSTRILLSLTAKRLDSREFRQDRPQNGKCAVLRAR